MKDEWMPVCGHENRYEVNSFGEIRRKGGKYLNPWKNYFGYKIVRLTNLLEGKREQRSVHRIVAESFIPNGGNKPFINHKDNNPSNNHVSNLEWCTQKENLAHARAQGRMYKHPKGLPSANASLEKSEVHKIRSLREDGMSYQKIANIVGTNKKTVMQIINKKTYLWA